eukprot:scaffold10953_cov120-Isochrysis_galbana.AAC.3
MDGVPGVEGGRWPAEDGHAPRHTAPPDGSERAAPPAVPFPPSVAPRPGAYSPAAPAERRGTVRCRSPALPSPRAWWGRGGDGSATAGQTRPHGSPPRPPLARGGVEGGGGRYGVITGRQLWHQFQKRTERRRAGGEFIQQLCQAALLRVHVLGVLVLACGRGQVRQPGRLCRVGRVLREEEQHLLGDGRPKVGVIPQGVRHRAGRRQRRRWPGQVAHSAAQRPQPEGCARGEAEPLGGPSRQIGAVVAQHSEVVGTVVPEPGLVLAGGGGELHVTD